MSTKIIRSIGVVTILGLAALFIRYTGPEALFERLFVLAVYLFFFFSYLVRLALLILGLYAVYRTLWKLANEPRTSQIVS